MVWWVWVALGLVRLGSELWRATAHLEIAPGTEVVVLRVEGVTVVVAPAEQV